MPADLLSAGRGTAYYSRVLQGIPDGALAHEADTPGWSRAQVVAWTALEARAFANAVEGLDTGLLLGGLSSAAELVDYTSTLGPTALRNLHHHTVVHLNVTWRDLAADRWSSPVDVFGRFFTPAEFVSHREQQVWAGALALNGRGRLADLPRQPDAGWRYIRPAAR